MKTYWNFLFVVWICYKIIVYSCTFNCLLIYPIIILFFFPLALWGLRIAFAFGYDSKTKIKKVQN